MHKLSRNESGAVFVEQLIGILPVLLAFFATWEVAEIGAASLVVQRASAAAGRAAMVVLPDDPLFYDEQPSGAYSGLRRADIELAAGMVLSAIPQLSDEFEVDVSELPSGFGTIDVTVRAPYECSALALVCQLNGGRILSSTTTHAYHGAKYAYTAAASSSPDVGVTVQALSGQQNSSNCGDNGVEPKCNAEGGFANNQYSKPAAQRGSGAVRPRATQPAPGSLARKALDFRCKSADAKSGKNFAALSYACPDANGDLVEQEPIINSSEPLMLHAELYVLGAFRSQAGPKCVITGLYTEREPCAGCRRQIAGYADQFAPGMDITYRYEWNVTDEELDKPPSDMKCKLPPVTECSALKKALATDKTLTAAERRACIRAVMWLEAKKSQDDLRTKSNQKVKAQCTN